LLQNERLTLETRWGTDNNKNLIKRIRFIFLRFAYSGRTWRVSMKFGFKPTTKFNGLTSFHT